MLYIGEDLARMTQGKERHTTETTNDLSPDIIISANKIKPLLQNLKLIEPGSNGILAYRWENSM